MSAVFFKDLTIDYLPDSLLNKYVPYELVIDRYDSQCQYNLIVEWPNTQSQFDLVIGGLVTYDAWDSTELGVIRFKIVPYDPTEISKTTFLQTLHEHLISFSIKDSISDFVTHTTISTIQSTFKLTSDVDTLSTLLDLSEMNVSSCLSSSIVDIDVQRTLPYYDKYLVVHYDPDTLFEMYDEV